MALTDELLGAADEAGYYRFSNGGRVHSSHAHGTPSALSPPSSWPFGGDVIPVANGVSVLVPLVTPDGSLHPHVLHAYTWSAISPQPDPACPLFHNVDHAAGMCAVKDSIEETATPCILAVPVVSCYPRQLPWCEQYRAGQLGCASHGGV